MSKVLKYMPELEGDEQLQVAQLIKPLNEEQAEQFAHVYRARRKDPNITLFTTLVGFLAVAGIQRFYLGQTGMGILYLLTGGLCAIGTIYDLVKHRALTERYNVKKAEEVAEMIARVLPAEPTVGLLEE